MSLTFHPFDYMAAKVTAPYFHARKDRFCDRTVGVNYMWRTPFNCAYAITDGCLLLQVSYSDKGIYFTYPIGGDEAAALSALEQYCTQTGLPLQFATVSDEELAALRERYTTVHATSNRDYFDYLYHYADLATFAGRRYSAQRNHINRFVKQWPNWAYHPLMREDVPKIKAFLHDLLTHKTANEPLSRSEQLEVLGCNDLLDVMHELDMVGGYITVDDAIVAFSVAEIIGDTMYVHIEKGDTRYPGVYQVIVREFAAHNAAPHILYINREDDAGDAGLRQSKLAYRPCALLEKSLVVIGER
ncbi:MAG: DUF2156 domain-containing protein [Clostridia bacterium]|nr:DUF2156 domain-containing protein [Clostridia bacterium]